MTDYNDWEDPAVWTEWITRLSEQLVKRDLQYIGLKRIHRMKTDPDSLENDELVDTDPRANATLTAASAVGIVVAALKEIPTFHSGWGVAALNDVAAALVDADAGARPKLFEPRPDQKAPKAGVGRRVLVAAIVMCVELLNASGENIMDACSIVAGAFAGVGHQGRKGGGLSPKTVHEWSAKSSDDIKLRVMIDQAIGQWRADHGWPPQRSDVDELIRAKTLDPFLLTQI